MCSRRCRMLQLGHTARLLCNDWWQVRIWSSSRWIRTHRCWYRPPVMRSLSLTSEWPSSDRFTLRHEPWSRDQFLPRDTMLVRYRWQFLSPLLRACVCLRVCTLLCPELGIRCIKRRCHPSVRPSVRQSIPLSDSVHPLDGDMRASPFRTHSIGGSMVGYARIRMLSGYHWYLYQSVVSIVKEKIKEQYRLRCGETICLRHGYRRLRQTMEFLFIFCNNNFARFSWYWNYIFLGLKDVLETSTWWFYDSESDFQRGVSYSYFSVLS